MATVEAQEGGPQPIETLPDASNMTPSNAAAESSAPGARDEEDDDGAGGTQRNDADGEPKKKRAARRPKLDVEFESDAHASDALRPTSAFAARVLPQLARVIPPPPSRRQM